MAIGETITRRQLLALLLSTGVMALVVKPASASDGEGESGESDSGDSDSGDSDSGDSDSGDSDSSGKGSDDGDTDSDDDGDDSSGSSNSGSGNGRIDPDNIRKAIVSGKAISLSRAMAMLSKSSKDRVIDVRLISKGASFDYRFKVISSSGKVKTISMDAKTGRIRNFFGM